MHALPDSLRKRRRVMFTIKAIRNWSRRHAAQLRLARLLSALIFLAGGMAAALLASKNQLDWVRVVEAQESTTMTTPHAPSAIPPPLDMQVVQESSQTSTSTTSIQGR